MERSQQNDARKVLALKVRQWLPEWESVEYDEDSHRRKPEPHFYLFTLPAAELKALTGIRRRTTEGGLLRSQDLGNQRRHDPARSEEIGQFVRYGYPWSDLDQVKRESGRFDDLRKPGWLPTTIVLNIRTPDDERGNREVAAPDLITVHEGDGPTAVIRLPAGFDGPQWRPAHYPPLEVIDGQHRLWAFENEHVDSGFELPVVAFHGLDISWQAYLFWTINIKPKRINASLAFDMYPLLRTEDWLERFEGHSIYRETRAQELTEAMWAHPESPWYHRINMLGDPGNRSVRQAAWIRSLLATYVKSFEGPGIAIGGLFGAPVGSDQEALPWSRAQQAAFLILGWQTLRGAIRDSTVPWAVDLRTTSQQPLLEQEYDPAFAGPYTLLNTDQGVRGVLFITNDLCYILASDLRLREWQAEDDAAAADEPAVHRALTSLRAQEVSRFLSSVAGHLATFDWRSASAPSLARSEDERSVKLVFRGSGGYRELRRQLLRHLARDVGMVGSAARDVLDMLGYQ